MQTRQRPWGPSALSSDSPVVTSALPVPAGNTLRSPSSSPPGPGMVVSDFFVEWQQPVGLKRVGEGS